MTSQDTPEQDEGEPVTSDDEYAEEGAPESGFEDDVEDE